MKVNVIIRIEDCDDTEQAIEAKFNECDTEILLGKEALKHIHPIILEYVRMFRDAGGTETGGKSRKPILPQSGVSGADPTKTASDAPRAQCSKLQPLKTRALSEADHFRNGDFQGTGGSPS